MGESYEDRAEYLVEHTALKRREADVYALKEQGLTHAEIAERLDLSKSTVDEYSRRINDRVARAQATLEEVSV